MTMEKILIYLIASAIVLPVALSQEPDDFHPQDDHYPQEDHYPQNDSYPQDDHNPQDDHYQDDPYPQDDPYEDCDGFACVTKCCPIDQIINMTECVEPWNKSELWVPTFYGETEEPLQGPPSNVKLKSMFPNCDMFPLLPHANPDDRFYLLETGRLHVPLYKNDYEPQRYCLDNFHISLTETVEVALLCFDDDSPTEEPSRACDVAKEYVYPVLLMVSCVFFAITLFVYIWVPELRGKLHGRCLLSLVSSLLTAYCLMTIIQLATEGMSDPVCLACAFLKQMTVLASFFWMNVMCFDIWRSLKSMRPAAETSAKSRQRFLLYSIYAWGSPPIICSVTMIIQNLNKSHTNIVRPNFLNDRQMCWFDSNKSIWLYFYMIILILVSLNTIFFGMVAYILIKSGNNQRLQRARSQNRDRLWLYGKLFVVMGVTWITEVISWQQGTCEAWILTDIINALQGFTIFLVFVCKKSTRQMVSRRMANMKSHFTNSTSKSKRSSNFFASLSQSDTQNTNSSVISRSSETQSLTGFSAQRNTHNPMSSIRETDNAVEEMSRETSANCQFGDNNTTKIPEMDEDCPSIPEHQSSQELYGSASAESPPGDPSELPIDSEEHSEIPTDSGENVPDASRYVIPSENQSNVNGINSSEMDGGQNSGEDSAPESSQLGEMSQLIPPVKDTHCSENLKSMQPEENSPLLARNDTT